MVTALMPPGPLVMLALAAAGLGLMAFAVLRSRRLSPDVSAFMVGLVYDDRDEQADLQRRLAEPIIPRLARSLSKAIGSKIERFLPHNHIEQVRRQLAQAGLGSRRGVGEQIAMQIGLAFLGLFAVRFVPSGSPAMGLATLLLLPALGFMIPSVLLKRRIQSRSDAIFKDLPDIVDMLAIAVEAGSGFESALSIICKNFDSPLTDELTIALHDMELGLPRKQALQQLRDRIDVEAVRVLILVLLQADALGIPIGRVLKAQSTEVRARRRAWAREKAAKLPVKIMFPLVAFIFPPIMALVLGPAASSFGQLGN